MAQRYYEIQKKMMLIKLFKTQNINNSQRQFVSLSLFGMIYDKIHEILRHIINDSNQISLNLKPLTKRITHR
jgi:hypothetical protein